MRKILLTILLLFYAISFSQEITTVKGTILNANNNMVLQEKLSLPPKRQKGIILQGSEEEACDNLVRLLRDEEKII